MSRIIAIVTFYNPNPESANNVLLISKQSDITIICDNSDENNINLVKNLNNSIKYHPNYDNLGLSAAFNSVLKDRKIVDWKDDDFVVFFDQDSIIKDGHVLKLIEEYKNLESKGHKVGCIGPVYYDLSCHSVRKPIISKKLSTYSVAVANIMTSSMLCKYKNLKMVNFWSEDIFLDMADWDICWKMKQKGLIIAMTQKCLFTHKLGEMSKKFGFIRLDVGKPFREYYQTRDCIYLLKKNYVPIKMRIRLFLNLSLRPLLHILFLDKRDERKYYIKLGFKHARKRVRGKLI